ncbi:MAG: SufD family Fe-S cluster assembly protein [Candidatus Gracilibacteria bacterium]|nr:SufD family Fe-S cluster assembly protein [Candidatus Gracilibacteria bacterium]
MRITKNGFYKLSELLNLSFLSEGASFRTKGVPVGGGIIKINIDDNVFAIFFDDLFLTNSLLDSVNYSSNIEIELGKSSKLEFYGVLNGKEIESNIKILQDNQYSELKVRYIILSKNLEKIKSKFYSEIGASNTKSDIHIISIVGKDGLVDLDGIIQINNGIVKVNANLLEENIFLGDGGKVKGIPTLLVRSNDVNASHACRIEKISDEKLFYLRSRGIDRENALFMMIDSYISNMFICLSMVDNIFYKEIFENIIKKIK